MHRDFLHQKKVDQLEAQIDAEKSRADAAESELARYRERFGELNDSPVSE